MASQYGFDGAKVTNTVSAYKTAELGRKKTQRGFDKEDAEFEEYGNYITKHNKDSITKAVDENEDGIVDANEEKNALLNTGKKWGAIKDLRATDEKTANAKNIISNRNARTGISRGHLKIAQGKAQRLIEKSKKAEAKFVEEQKAYERMLIKADPTLSKQEVKDRTTLKNKGMKDILGNIDNANSANVAGVKAKSIEIVKGTVESNYNLVKEKDSIKKQEMWTEKITTLTDQAEEAYKAGNKDLGDSLTEQKDKIPKTLPSEAVLMDNYMSSLSVLKVLEEYEPKKKTTGKITENQKGIRKEKNEKRINTIAKDRDIFPNSEQADEALFLAYKRNKEGKDASPEESYIKASKIVLKKYASGKKAKSGEANPVKYQVSEDGKKIYNGKKWVKYNKKK